MMQHFVHLEKNEFELAPGQKVIEANEYLAYQEANDVLRAAREQAQQMSEKARKAYEMEEEYGYQDGLERAKSDMAEHIVANAERSIAFIEALENDAVAIVVAAVEKIIGDFDDAEKAKRVVSKLLSSVKREQHIKLRVSADCAEVVEEALSNHPEAEAPAKVEITPDSKLSADTFILETSTGIVDGSVSTQIETLKNSLQKSLRGSEV